MRYYTAGGFRDLILAVSADEELLQKLEEVRKSKSDVDEAFLSYLLTVIADRTSPGEPGNEDRVVSELHQKATWMTHLAELLKQ